VKIKVVHSVCGREILVQQILESQGHCPWDGKAFDRDYTALIAEALEAAERSGSILENALEKLAGYGPDFVIEEATVLGPLRAALDELNKRPAGVRP
jgi:hypothetical protein